MSELAEIRRRKPARSSNSNVRNLRGEVLDEATQWQGGLLLTDRGKALANLANALHALRRAPSWTGRIAFDELRQVVIVRHSPPFSRRQGAWSDTDDALTAEWLQRQGINVSPQIAAEAVQVVAREYGFHPVRDYLNSIEWDGVERLPYFLSNYVGALNTPLNHEIGLRFMIAAVARAFNPGCKADHMLVLEGAQGVGKSSAVAILGGEYHGEISTSLNGKEAVEQLQGKWMVEETELSAMVRTQIEATKAFISRTHDRMRPAYGRRLVEYPRSCIFVGTTNSLDWHGDQSGGRRFWPVRVGDQIDLTGLARDRDQLFAEAVARFRRGEPWHLTDASMIAAQREEMDQRIPEDAWQGPILEEADRRGGRISIRDALCAVNVTLDKARTAETKRAAAILTSNGFKRAKLSEAGRRSWTYVRGRS